MLQLARRKVNSPSMRNSRCLSLLVLLTLCASLAACATFCDDEGLDPFDPVGHSSAPLSEHECYDERGRRCVTATIFDVVYALQEADRAP